MLMGSWVPPGTRGLVPSHARKAIAWVGHGDRSGASFISFPGADVGEVAGDGGGGGHLRADEVGAAAAALAAFEVAVGGGRAAFAG